MVGAHIDHLGLGTGGSSLAREDEVDQVHAGADDNASGVAAMLEIAQYLASEKSKGRLNSQRDLIVAAWSGEELGLFGSKAFVEDFYDLYPSANRPETEGGSDDLDIKPVDVAAHGAPGQEVALTQAVAAYLNLDMVGRLREKLVVQGIGSSPSLRAMSSVVTSRLDCHCNWTRLAQITNGYFSICREARFYSFRFHGGSRRLSHPKRYRG